MVRVGIRSVAAPVGVRVAVASCVEGVVVVSRRVMVPVGLPVVVDTVWAVKVIGGWVLESGTDRVVMVGAGLMVRVKAVLWAAEWVWSPA